MLFQLTENIQTPDHLPLVEKLRGPGSVKHVWNFRALINSLGEFCGGLKSSVPFAVQQRVGWEAIPQSSFPSMYLRHLAQHTASSREREIMFLSDLELSPTTIQESEKRLLNRTLPLLPLLCLLYTWYESGVLGNFQEKQKTSWKGARKIREKDTEADLGVVCYLYVSTLNRAEI